MSRETQAQISIVVPTIDEGANIVELVQRIDRAMQAYRYELLIVDDNSADGTVEVCEGLRYKYPLALHVRTTRTAGLGGAVMHGFMRCGGEVIVVLDGDLQHPPEHIGALIRPILQDRADLVIGSRFTEGATVPKDWPAVRKMMSGIGRSLARPLAGSVRDPLSGFFAVRRNHLNDACTINPLGFKIGLEVICKCRRARIVEVPIDFGARRYGSSKMALREQLRYLVHLSRLYRFVYLGLWSRRVSVGWRHA